MLPQAATSNLLQYDGRLGRIYTIWIVNFILTIITFGIYRAWAKTRMRHYLYGSFSILGDRLEYSGTGGELFRAFIKVAIIIFIVLFVFSLVLMLGFNFNENQASRMVNLVYIPGFFALAYYGKFSALRYRLTRTRWRGVRGHLRGSAQDYMWFRMRRLLINIATLGLAIGRTDLMAREYIINRMYLGSQPCSFNGDYTVLDRINFITLLLALPTLFMSRIWYRAALLKAQYDYMSAGTLDFHGTHTGGSLFALRFVNILIVIFTFGLGIPIALQRTLTYFNEHTHLTGDIDGSNILQSEAEAGAFGEGIVEDLDMDEGIDFDMGFI